MKIFPYTTGIVFMALLLALMPSPAFAHTKSQSFSSWQVDGSRADVIFAVDARRVTQLAQLYDDPMPLEALLAAHLEETISLRQAGAPCPQTGLRITDKDAATLRVRINFLCPQTIDDNDSVRITAFHTVSATHLHIARVTIGEDDNGREYLLNETTPGFSVQLQSGPRDIVGFIWLGFFHVLSGLDHLAFLAALALVARTRRRAILCVTGFTVGHSLTLALATFGRISPDLPLIEAMIGFTIAASALEASEPRARRPVFGAFAVFTFVIVALPLGLDHSLLGFGLALAAFAWAIGQLAARQSARLVPLIAVAFGLVHGAGFAGGLTQLDLARDQLAVPLFGFNIGVELGQLVALAGLYLSTATLAVAIPQIRSQGPQWLTVFLFGTGCFWFAERIWS